MSSVSNAAAAAAAAIIPAPIYKVNQDEQANSGFCTLPLDMIREILLFTPITSFGALSLSCKKIYQIIVEKKLLKERFSFEMISKCEFWENRAMSIIGDVNQFKQQKDYYINKVSEDFFSKMSLDEQSKWIDERKKREIEELNHRLVRTRIVYKAHLDPNSFDHKEHKNKDYSFVASNYAVILAAKYALETGDSKDIFHAGHLLTNFCQKYFNDYRDKIRNDSGTIYNLNEYTFNMIAKATKDPKDIAIARDWISTERRVEKRAKLYSDLAISCKGNSEIYVQELMKILKLAEKEINAMLQEKDGVRLQTFKNHASDHFLTLVATVKTLVFHNISS